MEAFSEVTHFTRKSGIGPTAMNPRKERPTIPAFPPITMGKLDPVYERFLTWPYPRAALLPRSIRSLNRQLPNAISCVVESESRSQQPPPPEQPTPLTPVELQLLYIPHSLATFRPAVHQRPQHPSFSISLSRPTPRSQFPALPRAKIETEQYVLTLNMMIPALFIVPMSHSHGTTA